MSLHDILPEKKERLYPEPPTARDLRTGQCEAILRCLHEEKEKWVKKTRLIRESKAENFTARISDLRNAGFIIEWNRQRTKKKNAYKLLEPTVPWDWQKVNWQDLDSTLEGMR